ncbi:MAG: hypothetical protein IPI07_05135 [Flavobacteriales bacterium]|nr:hypothetical protein [Flavobacteriales bacterium]
MRIPLVILAIGMMIAVKAQVDWGPCLFGSIERLTMRYQTTSNLGTKPPSRPQADWGVSGGLSFSTNRSNSFRFSSGILFAYDRGTSIASSDYAYWGGSYGTVRMAVQRLDVPLTMLVRLVPKFDLIFGQGFGFTLEHRYELERYVPYHEIVNGTYVEVVRAEKTVLHGEPPGVLLTMRVTLGAAYKVSEHWTIVGTYDMDLTGTSQLNSTRGRLDRARFGVQYSLFDLNSDRPKEKVSP